MPNDAPFDDSLTAINDDAFRSDECAQKEPQSLIGAISPLKKAEKHQTFQQDLTNVIYLIFSTSAAAIDYI